MYSMDVRSVHLERVAQWHVADVAIVQTFLAREDPLLNVAILEVLLQPQEHNQCHSYLWEVKKSMRHSGQYGGVAYASDEVKQIDKC